MDDLIEFILELIIDGCIEFLPDKKIPKWLRVIMALVILAVAIGVIVLGVVLLRASIIVGVGMIIIGIGFLIATIVKVKKYKKD